MAATFDFSPPRLEACGSLAKGEVRPPYSDIDVMIVSSSGDGMRVRDAVPQLAASLNRRLLAIFVDPLSSEGIFCSIYSGPLKVDWFVAEQDTVRRAMVWNGNKPPPYDWKSHPWDWTWWLWCKLKNGKYDLVSSELPKLWQILRTHGSDVDEFPPAVPDPRNVRNLEEFIVRTLDKLPKDNAPLVDEITLAIRASR